MINYEQKLLLDLTIMYVEDDSDIRNSVLKTLKMIFKFVYVFENAEEALVHYRKNKPDIILSDINLPKMSGIEFCKIIREDNIDIPIILLTAYTNKNILLEATKLRLINYIVKPVVFDELYNAFKDAAKDIIRTSNKILKFSNNTEYNLSNKILYANNKEVHLTSSENRLLEIFIRNLDKTVPIIEIKEELWDDAYDATDSALKSILSKLRSKIGKNTIKNVSGMGYYLVKENFYK